MHPVYHFILWFTISLLGIFFLVSTISNKFTISFIIALVMGTLIAKDMK